MVFAYHPFELIKQRNMNKYNVTMVERQKDGTTRTLTQTAVCNSEKEVIDWYGLNEPDIVSYDIKLAN